MGKSILKNNVKRNISFILRIKPNKGEGGGNHDSF